MKTYRGLFASNKVNVTYKISLDVDGDTNGSLDLFVIIFHAACIRRPNFLFTSVKGEEEGMDKRSNTPPPICLGWAV